MSPTVGLNACKSLKTGGTHHRALADAEMTAHLWIRMIEDIRNDYGLQAVPFGLMQKLGKISKKKVPEFMQKMRLKE
jgi:DNA polymerase-3 subunit epsilon